MVLTNSSPLMLPMKQHRPIGNSHFMTRSAETRFANVAGQPAKHLPRLPGQCRPNRLGNGTCGILDVG